MRGKMTEEEIKSENNGAEPETGKDSKQTAGDAAASRRSHFGDSSEPEYEVVHHPHLFRV